MIEIRVNAVGLNCPRELDLGKSGRKKTEVATPLAVAGKEVMKGAERSGFANNVVLDKPVDTLVMVANHEGKVSSRMERSPGCSPERSFGTLRAFDWPLAVPGTSLNLKGLSACHYGYCGASLV